MENFIFVQWNMLFFVQLFRHQLSFYHIYKVCCNLE